MDNDPMTWIPVDKPPTKEECEKNCGWFIVWRPTWSLRPDISRYDGYLEYPCYDHKWKYQWDGTITHWMPLPEPPK